MRAHRVLKLMLSLLTLSCISFIANANPCIDSLFDDGFSRAETHKNRVTPQPINPIDMPSKKISDLKEVKKELLLLVDPQYIASQALKNSNIVNFGEQQAPGKNKTYNRLTSANNYFVANSKPSSTKYFQISSLHMSFDNLENFYKHLYRRLASFEIAKHKEADFNSVNDIVLKTIEKNLEHIVTIDFLMLETLMLSLTKNNFITLNDGHFLKTSKAIKNIQTMRYLEFFELLNTELNKPELTNVRVILYRSIANSR